MQELINWVFFANEANKSECPHRQCLLLSHENAIAQAKDLLAHAPASAALCWLGDDAPTSAIHIPVAQYRRLLGQEFDVAVYNAFAPFRPSAVLALAGTLRGGGRLIIACPPLCDWPTHCDVLDTHFVSHGWQLTRSHYIAHWINLARHDPAVAIASANQLHLPVALGLRPMSVKDPQFITLDQIQTYDALMSTPGSAVITAARGRGKTALLGEIAGTLLANGESVVLTSKHYESVLPLISRLRARDDLKEIAKGQFMHMTTQMPLKWVAPDNPLLTEYTNAVLMIDEAASLPLPQIRSLIDQSTRSILATTTDGYEGSGQGFLHRFIPYHLSQTGAAHYHLNTPIRWLENDPLERLTSQGLLFYPEEKRSSTNNTDQELTLGWSDFSQMAQNETHHVLQLLVQAHYQTTPDDLMRLLDAPDIKLLVATRGNAVVGATVINVEGGSRLDDVATGIACGARRVKGHLSAQRIALMLCVPGAATATYWRINRIAVAPVEQSRGYGSKMLARVIDDAGINQVDAVTSSFGYTEALGKFWQANRFVTIQHGIKKDKASGHASALVFHAINQRAKAFIPLLLAINAQENEAMDRTHVAALAACNRDVELTALLDEMHKTKLEQLVTGTRDTSQCLGSLRWLATNLEDNANSNLKTLSNPPELPLLSYLRNNPFNNEALQCHGSLASRAKLKSALQDEVKEALQLVSVADSVNR